MKYKSCQWINRGIEFRTDSLRLCCFGHLNGRITEYQTTIKKNYYGGKIDWNEIFKIKNQLKSMNKNGEFLDACKNCIYLSENEWDDENYINHFTFNHWTRCNCGCIYCYSFYNKEECNSYKEYPIYPVIKDMFDDGIIRKPNEGCVNFGGGEPVILQDFDKLINIFLDNGFKTIRINSSGIKYSESIEKGLKQGCVSIVISPDAGTKETFERIKQVKCYDKVWENIRGYAAANTKLLKVKYILIPGVNDNFDEINKWFDEVLNNGVKSVCLGVEMGWLNKFTPNFPSDVCEKLEYMEKRSADLGLELEIYAEALTVLDKYRQQNKL